MTRDAQDVSHVDSMAILYRLAWDRYEGSCLWNIRKAEVPDRLDAEETAKALRSNGDLEACLLGDRLKELCRAA